MKKTVLIILAVILIISLVGCAKKESSAGCRIVVAKESDGLDTGAALSAEDAASLMAQITAAEAETQWIDAVSNSIASCFLSIETAGETTRYQYSESGVLDDLTHMRSLTLGDAQIDTVNGLLSGYVDLQISLAPIPIPDELIPIHPKTNP